MRRISKLKLKGTARRDIFLKSPTPKSDRATFAIVERSNGKNKTLKSESLAAINKRLLAKKLNFSQARQLASEVIDQMQPRTAVLHNQANLKLLDEYWEKEYSQRELVDTRSAWNRLMRAIEAVGHYSMVAAGRDELQQEIDKKFRGNKHRAVVSALNQILKFTGRNIKLRKAREEIVQVSYITDEELKLILPQIENEKLRLMHEVAFATGLRAGELFGLLPENIKEDYIEVGSQIDVSRSHSHLHKKCV